MFIQRSRHGPRARVLFALAVLLASAPLARAADPESPGDTEDGWRKVVAYGRCAVQVFAAVTPAQWAGAFLDCARTFLDEPPVGSGGQ